MPLKYQSGEDILRGDHVRYHGANGTVAFVVDPSNPTSETEWFVQEYGGGVMISDSQIGSVFTSEPAEDGCLEFVRRGGLDADH